ncbi:MAG: ATP-binding protein [Desulfuromonadales bacterium]|nr:ATP-binding protein [Desulfuromonadales bacterium]
MITGPEFGARLTGDHFISGVHMQGSLFEEDYLVRTLGSIAHAPDIALTELVANAWDAGASKVKIFIPEKRGGKLIVEDDGCGMTAAQFKTRWMTLAYNRIKHQGSKAEFPPERADWRRWAYGRNGVGRHGMLCFADHYEVETWKGDSGGRFKISTSSSSDPFVLEEERPYQAKGHGTRLIAEVVRHLPPVDKIREVLSARFLHDPKFEVIVNGRSVPLTDHPGLLDQTELLVLPCIKLCAMFIDSTKAARTMIRQGVAFWVGGRLVGDPSWVLGNRSLADGRTHFAKRYTAVIKTEDLFGEIQLDWSGFKRSETVDNVFTVVEEYVRQMFVKVSGERIQETKETVYRENRTNLSELRPLAKLEVAQFIDDITTQSPTVQPEALSLAVQALINLEQSRSGAALLKRLSTFSEEDIEGLDRLLSDWTVKDALAVLDEIDRRITVIEAIKKLSGDPHVDELKTLHPLVTEARWLFGPEFDTHEYSSNVSLKNAVKKVFGATAKGCDFINSRKRPDLVILRDSTLSAVAVESFDSNSGLIKMQNILIIELKKGGFTIGRKEIDQAIAYVEDMLHSGHIEGAPFVMAYVVGDRISDRTSPTRGIGENPILGKVQAMPFGQLVRTAEARLFKLREKLHDRYDDVPGTELLNKVLGESQQQILKLA